MISLRSEKVSVWLSVCVGKEPQTSHDDSWAKEGTDTHSNTNIFSHIRMQIYFHN